MSEEAEAKFRVIAYDPDGFPRLFMTTSEWPTESDNKDMWIEIMGYLDRRPDRGPLDKWNVDIVTL
jgi:hypothetical protein